MDLMWRERKIFRCGTIAPNCCRRAVGSHLSCILEDKAETDLSSLVLLTPYSSPGFLKI
jgi:N-acetylglutamate synthase-like GNAT family acetyltransferase